MSFVCCLGLCHGQMFGGGWQSLVVFTIVYIALCTGFNGVGNFSECVESGVEFDGKGCIWELGYLVG